jgi:hypothetical protein
MNHQNLLLERLNAVGGSLEASGESRHGDGGADCHERPVRSGHGAVRLWS